MSDALYQPKPVRVDSRNQNALEKGIPALDINKIIQLIVDVAKNDKTPEEAAKEFARPYQTFAEVYARDQAEKLIETGLGAIGLEMLSTRAFSEQIVRISEKIAVYVKAFMTGEITDQEFISRLGGSGIKDVTMQILSALGIHEKLGVDNPAEIMKLAPTVLAFSASMAAYKELRKAMDELETARERRIQIEEACRESVSMIRSYRREMERIVTNYLTVRLETFETGFEAMEKAMLNDDVNGYIRGNVEIQEVLGYDVQFESQDEFDALMESDDAFKL